MNTVQENIQAWPTPEIFVSGGGGANPVYVLATEDGANTLETEDAVNILQV